MLVPFYKRLCDVLKIMITMRIDNYDDDERFFISYRHCRCSATMLN